MLTPLDIPGVSMLKEQIRIDDPRAEHIMDHPQGQRRWFKGRRYVLHKFLAQGECLAVTWTAEKDHRGLLWKLLRRHPVR
jgi:hypothetical protein